MAAHVVSSVWQRTVRSVPSVSAVGCVARYSWLCVALLMGMGIDSAVMGMGTDSAVCSD